MNKPSSRHRIAINIVVIFLLAGCVFIIKADSLFSPIGKDSGAFAYSANYWLSGKMLYKDTHFDVKLPGIYFINAIGLILFGKSVLAIHLIDTIWIFLATVSIYFLGLKVFDLFTAGFMSLLLAIFASLPSLVRDGNHPSLYLVLPSTLAILFLINFLKNKKTRYLFASGFFWGSAFLIKQPALFEAMAIGVYIVLIAVIDREKPKTILKNILIFSISFLFPLAIVSSYLYIHGAFGEMIYSSFVFPFNMSVDGRNILENKVGMERLVDIFTHELKKLSQLFVFSIILIVLKPKKLDRINYLFMFWFTGSLFGALSGGISSGHYFAQVVPSMCTVIGIGIYRLHSSSLILKDDKKMLRTAVLSVILFCMFNSTLRAEVARFRDGFLGHFSNPRESTKEELLATFLKNNTNPGDYVYGHGSHSYLRICFIAERYFSTRHAISKMYDGSGYRAGNFPHPSKTEWMLKEVCDDIMKVRPKIIFRFSDETEPKDKFSHLAKWVSDNYYTLPEEDWPKELKSIPRILFEPVWFLKADSN